MVKKTHFFAKRCARFRPGVFGLTSLFASLLAGSLYASSISRDKPPACSEPQSERGRFEKQKTDGPPGEAVFGLGGIGSDSSAAIPGYAPQHGDVFDSISSSAEAPEHQAEARSLPPLDCPSVIGRERELQESFLGEGSWPDCLGRPIRC